MRRVGLGEDRKPASPPAPRKIDDFRPRSRRSDRAWSRTICRIRLSWEHDDMPHRLALFAVGLLIAYFPGHSVFGESPTGVSVETSAPSAVAASSGPQGAIIISDIARWNHPVKAVFGKYGVTVRKVIITNRHPVFEVEFPFDPQTEPNNELLNALFVDLLHANSHWAFSIMVPNDRMEFDVSQDRRTGKISIENRLVAPAE